MKANTQIIYSDMARIIIITREVLKWGLFQPCYIRSKVIPFSLQQALYLHSNLECRAHSCLNTVQYATLGWRMCDAAALKISVIDFCWICFCMCIWLASKRQKHWGCGHHARAQLSLLCVSLLCGRPRNACEDMQPRSFGPKSLIVFTLSLVRGSCKIFTSQILTNASGHFSLEKQDLRPDGHIILNRFCALRFLPGTQQNSEYQSQRRGMRKERLRKPHSREMLNAC